VNLSVIPNTGIGLPFVSYGGTAVFGQLIEIAMIFSVDRVGSGYKNIDLTKVSNYRRTYKGKKRVVDN